MHQFAKYLNAVDGTRSWSEIEPLFDDAFDPSATFVTADGEVDLAHWKQMARTLVERGTVISDFQITTRDGETATYSLTLTAPGEDPTQLAATARLRDGMVARVEPVDPASYSVLYAKNS
jgi:hypothetical protein